MRWRDDSAARLEARRHLLTAGRHPDAPYRSALRPTRRRRARWKEWLSWFPRLDWRR